MKLRLSADRRADERVAAMLKRHVENQAGSAPISVTRTAALRGRRDRES